MAYDFRETPLNTDLGNVSPSLSVDDPRYRRLGNSVVSSDVGVRTLVLADRQDVFRLKLCFGICLPSGLAISSYLVPRVVLGSPPTEVRRVAARRIVARVKTEMIGRVRARRTRFNQCPCMGVKVEFPKLGLPIAPTVQTKRPNPALIRIAVLKLFLKPSIFVSKKGAAPKRVAVSSQAMVVGGAKSRGSGSLFASLNRANGESGISPMVVMQHTALASVLGLAASVFDTSRIFWSHRSSSLGSVAGQDVQASLPFYFTTEVPCGV